MMYQLKKKACIARGMMVAVALVVAGMLSTSTALAQQNGQEDNRLVVATYNINQVYQQYATQSDTTRQMQEAQQKAQAAAQQGQTEQAQQQQQKMQQLQQQMIRQFQTKLQEAAKKVAEEHKAAAVVGSLTYASDQVQTKDITSTIIQEMVPQRQDNQPMQPGMGQ